MSKPVNRVPFKQKMKIALYVKDQLPRYDAERTPRKAAMDEVNHVFNTKLNPPTFYQILQDSEIVWNWKQDPTRNKHRAEGVKRMYRISVMARAIQKIYDELNLELPEDFKTVKQEVEEREAQGLGLDTQGTPVLTEKFQQEAKVEVKSQAAVPAHLSRSARGNVQPNPQN